MKNLKIAYLALATAVVMVATVSTGNAATGGSSQYQVAVEDRPATVGMGVYTFRTGPMHPIVGTLGSQPLLVGDGIPGTSFTTIRSYTSGTDYVQHNGLTLAAGAPPALELDGFVAAGEEAIPVGDPASPTGFVTMFRPGGYAPAPDDLVIRQTVAAVGTGFDDAAVMVKTEITNAGAVAVRVGVRYLWDLQIGSGDDGPAFKTKGPDGAELTIDWSFVDPDVSGFEIMDDNNRNACFGIGNSPVPYFAVRGSVIGPALLSPTPPTRLSFVSWPDISGLPGKFGGVTPAANAFDYAPTGADISTCLTSIDDTAVAYWWGDSPSNALNIAPGGTVSISAYVFAYLPSTPPTFTPPGVEGPAGDPTCSDGVDNDSDGSIDLADTDCAPPAGTVEGPPGDATCSDSVDNDSDGSIDQNDPGCVPPPSVEGPPGDVTCSDGIDNDADGATDQNDPGCVPAGPSVEGPPGDPTCGDGIDNDQDGSTDHNDPDCAVSNGAPLCGAVRPEVGVLWPPNHKLRTVKIVGATDPDGDTVAIDITSIRQDEPVSPMGDGNRCPDAGGIGRSAARLRAERSGGGDGRVYHIDFTADDGRGGTCSGSVTVCVPHDRSMSKACVDQGPLFDSTGPCTVNPLRSSIDR